MHHPASLFIAVAISSVVILIIAEGTCGCSGGTVVVVEPDCLCDELEEGSVAPADSSDDDDFLLTVTNTIGRPTVVYPAMAIVTGLFLYKAYHFKRDRRRARRRKERRFKKWKHGLEMQYAMRKPG